MHSSRMRTDCCSVCPGVGGLPRGVGGVRPKGGCLPRGVGGVCPKGGCLPIGGCLPGGRGFALGDPWGCLPRGVGVCPEGWVSAQRGGCLSRGGVCLGGGGQGVSGQKGVSAQKGECLPRGVDVCPEGWVSAKRGVSARGGVFPEGMSAWRSVCPAGGGECSVHFLSTKKDKLRTRKINMRRHNEQPRS